MPRAVAFVSDNEVFGLNWCGLSLSYPLHWTVRGAVKCGRSETERVVWTRRHELNSVVIALLSLSPPPSLSRCCCYFCLLKRINQIAIDKHAPKRAGASDTCTVLLFLPTRIQGSNQPRHTQIYHTASPHPPIPQT